MVTVINVVVVVQMIEIEHRKSSEPATPLTDDASTSETTEKSGIEKSTESEPAESDDDTQDELMTGQLRPLRLQLTPESQLDSIEPVCVELLDCSTSVREVLKWLTSASWCVSLCVCVCVCLSVCLCLSEIFCTTLTLVINVVIGTLTGWPI